MDIGASKNQVNACMRNLWWWTCTEMQTPCEVLRELWEHEADLEAVAQILNALWADARHVTMQPMTTSHLDTSLADEWSSAWREFHASPQHKLIQLIGGYAVGGIWDNNMSVMYFRVASTVNANLNSDDRVVVRELYARITTEVKQGVHRPRTQDEVYNI